MDASRPLPAEQAGEPVAKPVADPTSAEGTSPAESDGLRPARQLPVTDAVIETTRLVVGASLLAGRGISQIIRRFGTAESHDESDMSSGAGQPDPLAAPLLAMSAARTMLVGLTFAVERAVLDIADGLARRGGSISEAVVRSPAVAPLSRIVGERVLRWYARGAIEEQRSREYAGTALGGVTNVSIDYFMDNIDFDALLQSLSLDNLILQSTGGITGEMLDSVRSRAVGMDSVLDRITMKISRRAIREGPRARSSKADATGPGTDSGPSDSDPP